MTWINMLSPLQWALLLAIPPAVLSLYFLKLKRQEALVPSTMLWKRAIADVHVNRIWQKLRKNLLLYRQLLFLALLVLACVRPGWSGMNRAGERRIYIIDHSASMQATDTKPSRLDVAREKALRLIQDAGSNDSAMVISTSDRASVEQGFTNNRSLLEKAVQRIEPTTQMTEVSEAFRVAAGLANPGRLSFEDNVDIQVAEAVPATVYFFSDGAVGELNEAEFGQLKIEYVPIGEPETQNAGIVGFAIQRPESKEAQAKQGAVSVYGQAIQYGTDPVECTASLYLDNTFVDAQKVKLLPGKETGIEFELEGVESGALKLELDHTDALALDNVAYAAIRPDRQVSILLITSGNTALETALKTQRIGQIASVQIEPRSYLASPEYQTQASDAKYDLIIYDSCSPEKMPSASTLFIGGIPPADIQPRLPENLVDKPAEETAQDQWSFGEPNG
ncbi:MAG: vWA domain-containing protein, partial [Planctomycetota bacterium]